MVFATDGRIPAFNFVVLKDDKNYAAPYNLTPVVRKEILDKNPKIADALNSVAAKLNDETMAKLNASVDVDKKTPEEVAEGFPEGERADLTRATMAEGERRATAGASFADVPAFVRGLAFGDLPTRRRAARSEACST